MKKIILPFVAVMLFAAASNAQTQPKQSPNKTVAVAKPKTTKTMSSAKETVSTPKATTTTSHPVAIHKKHHKAKKAAKK